MSIVVGQLRYDPRLHIAAYRTAAGFFAVAYARSGRCYMPFAVAVTAEREHLAFHPAAGRTGAHLLSLCKACGGRCRLPVTEFVARGLSIRQRVCIAVAAIRADILGITALLAGGCNHICNVCMALGGYFHLLRGERGIAIGVCIVVAADGTYPIFPIACGNAVRCPVWHIQKAVAVRGLFLLPLTVIGLFILIAVIGLLPVLFRILTGACGFAFGELVEARRKTNCRRHGNQH